MKIKIFVGPRRDILHPPSKAVAKALRNLGFEAVQNVILGTYFEIDVGDMTREEVTAMLKKHAPDRLYNPVIEDISFELVEGEPAA